MLDFARNIGIIRRVQVSFPAVEKPIKIGGLSTAFIECKQKCKQECKQAFKSLLSMGIRKCAERNLGTFFILLNRKK